MQSGEITLRFGGAKPPFRTVPVAFEDEHVLNLEVGQGAQLQSITVRDPTRRLSPAAALAEPGGYKLVHDSAKNCLMIEFRPGAASRSDQLIADAFDVEGLPSLHLLWSAAEELEAIAVWNASRWIPCLAPQSPPGVSYLPGDDALTIKFFTGETVPSDLRGGTTTFESGLELAIQLDEERRLQLAVVFAASKWLPPDVVGSPAAALSVFGVIGEPDTVFLGLVAGRAAGVASTGGVEVEGFEIHAAFDGADRLIGLIVPNASRQLPHPFAEMGA